ncbi:MAG TPA: septal ring lytic transglycosylase RlpA family protein [Terriglobales bacterium]|nr:septal ring lytic transglycosylase RlpA family protein [Terriglobales bacterium]
MLPPLPPQSLPPGVTWGSAGPTSETAAAPVATNEPTGEKAASPSPRPRKRGDDSPTGGYPTPPTGMALPAGNYSRDYTTGEVWETGIASFYGPREQGNFTASGERFDYHQMTAAHRLLPLGTRIKVTDLKTNKTVKVTINDRGPFWPNRILDLSWGAAQKIGDQGLDPVRIEILSLPDPVPAGVYTVQVGWFTDPGKLADCRQEMEQQLHQPVIAFGSDEGRWLRYSKQIRLDASTATEVVKSLREQNYPAYLVRLN